MNAIRLTYDKPPCEVRIPDELLRRPLEIIIMALGDVEDTPRKEPQRAGLATFAGKWQGGTLVREDQGEYEERKAFR